MGAMRVHGCESSGPRPKTRDYTPIYYLIDKYLRDDQARRDEAISRLGTMLPELTQLLKLAGVA